MKPIVPILGLASILWLFLGPWWLSKMVCSTGETTTFNVRDGKFNAHSAETFSFLKSSDEIQFSKGTEAAFKKVAKHLKDNPNKQLMLTGLYDNDEKNASSYENLGIARAERIKSLLIKYGANGDLISTTSTPTDNLSFDKNRKMLGGVQFLFADGDAGNDDSSSISQENGNSDLGASSSFDPGSSMFLDITEVSSEFAENESFKNYFADLKNYLTNNTGKKLYVTCYNDDSKLAKNITRKVKATIEKLLGMDEISIRRKVGKEADSPNGVAGVKIEIR
ncbi:MAG TPA: hypothetical protein ENJ45_02470 [Phaeodactylibacter sp.]|nr:hypothetical protein [Phaeodactylibacter sp.]